MMPPSRASVPQMSASTAAGQTLTLSDTAPTADRWNLAAVEVLPAGAPPPPPPPYGAPITLEQAKKVVAGAEAEAKKNKWKRLVWTKSSCPMADVTISLAATRGRYTACEDWRAAVTALTVSDQVIVVNSFSKYYSMTGWRIGWLVLPPELVQHMDDEHVAVFIPTTPSPVNGFYFYVKRSEVVELNMSVDEALKYVVSMGVVAPSNWTTTELVAKES